MRFFAHVDTRFGFCELVSCSLKVAISTSGKEKNPFIFLTTETITIILRLKKERSIIIKKMIRFSF